MAKKDKSIVVVEPIKTEELEKQLAKEGRRIVSMKDVTVTKEKLTLAVRKSAKLPGNEIPAFVEFLLKEIIMS